MRSLKFSLVAAVLLIVAASTEAGTVTLVSGNGTIGSTDSLITYKDGPNSSDFPAFIGTDFSDALAGPNADIIVQNGNWTGPFGGAQWIGTNFSAGGSSGDTALYAISFNLASPFSAASIVFNYAVDNLLGSTNEGLYLNGTALSGNTIGGTFGSQFTISRNDIASLLVVGANTLYVDAVNQGGPAGLIFSATINTTDVTSTPEPASLISAGLGIVFGAIAIARRRKTASA